MNDRGKQITQTYAQRLPLVVDDFFVLIEVRGKPREVSQQRLPTTKTLLA